MTASAGRQDEDRAPGIEQRSKVLLAITELPYSNDHRSRSFRVDPGGQTRRQDQDQEVDDNTADSVEILVHLPQGSSRRKVNPAAVRLHGLPGWRSRLGLRDRRGQARLHRRPEILRRSVDKTVELLKKELEIRLGELAQQWHWDSLDGYSSRSASTVGFEKSRTWESVLLGDPRGARPPSSRSSAAAVG